MLGKFSRTLATLLLIGLAVFVVTGVFGVSEAAAHEPDASHPHSQEAASEAGDTPLLDNLGDSHHPITTQSELAQRYFNQGLILAYGFNHEKAIESFKEALKYDPGCAMCYWGIAYALGPNINAPMADTAVPEAYAAIQQAQKLAVSSVPFISAVPEVSKAIQQEQKLAANVSPRELAYIEALAERYSDEPVTDRAGLDLAYANAMRQVAGQYPNDPDAVTLFAEALMDLMPWNYWTKAGQPTEYTEEIVTTLESVLERYPNHAGANHFYIHAVEASFTPERALPSAERLETLVPGAGHLVHMPAHIYWRTGRYEDAYRINIHAIEADEHMVGGTPDKGSRTFYSLAYYPHNIHFQFAAAQMEGNSQATIEAARRLVADIPEEGYREAPGLEDFIPVPLFGLVRFNQWEAILQEPQPGAEFQYATGIWHWARGLAYTNLGQLDEAAAEYDQLLAIAGNEAMDELILYSFAQASTMLDIASHVLAGELAGARGETEQGLAELEQAVAIQDGLHYIEPPAWHYPVRHNLGVALLDAGRPAEAEAVYREDLRQYPNNGWSLFGLAESLKAQGKTAEAAEVQQQFKTAWQGADVQLISSITIDTASELAEK